MALLPGASLPSHPALLSSLGHLTRRTHTQLPTHRSLTHLAGLDLRTRSPNATLSALPTLSLGTAVTHVLLPHTGYLLLVHAGPREP